MNSHVRRFYRKHVDEELPVRFYNEVIALHENPHVPWDEIRQKVPLLPKGWYELAQLLPGDRIEFIKEFWLSSVPFISHIHTRLESFFNRLDDVGVFAVQSQFDSPFECEIVYSLRDESSFFHGFPIPEGMIERLKEEFNGVLPQDYLSFLAIHDGFSKHSDTGLIRALQLRAFYDTFQEKIQSEAVYTGNKLVLSGDLIPFYESFGQPAFQCFYANWTPMGSMGNVCFSLAEGKISDVNDPNSLEENLAFPTFLDWLTSYLENIEE